KARTIPVSILAIALLAWFLRHANLIDVWRQIRAARMAEMLVACSLFIPMMVIRALRWRYLLQPVGSVRFSTALRTTMIGFAVSRAPKALALAIVWSFALWITIAMQSWLVTTAFGIDMPITGSFLLQALLVVGIAVPTPGGVGGYHEAYRIGTTMFFHASN